MLAEVQRALQAECREPIRGLSGEPGTGSRDGRRVKDEGDALSVETTQMEVAVVRVALPSAVEREQVRAPSVLPRFSMVTCYAGV